MLPSQHRDSASWADLLDRMEEDLGRTAGESSPLVAWTAPEGLGPILPEEADRARRILTAQQQAIESLEKLKESTGHHLAALRTVPAVRGDGDSVYLDVTG